MTNIDERSYPVAWFRDVKKYSLVRSKISGLEIVIWKSLSGKVHVWEDRCPHRSVRLSAGRCVGNYVEGVYHGWRFGEDGLVSSVPAEGGAAHPEISVRIVSSVVSGGIVWASLSEKAVPESELHGVPLQPIHIRAESSIVKSEVERIAPDLQAFVTPWAKGESFLFASINGGSNIREENQRLIAMRNNIERRTQ